jgi:inorganic triphosphatase YgiF
LVTRLTGSEYESALIAIAGAELLAEIEALHELDGYVLVPRALETIVDEYFDTPDARLGARHIALRVRYLDGAPRLTLKGPTERRAGPASRRLEIERPWSIVAAGQALRSLASLEVPLARCTASRAWRNPSDFAKDLGLARVQHREALRRPRDVRAKSGGTPRPLAEMALDTVTYSIGRRKVRLFEVEIEAKRREGIRAADRVTELLLAGRRRSLNAWRHSKLATGLALESMEREGNLAGLLASGGWLTPKGIKALARRLARSRD